MPGGPGRHPVSATLFARGCALCPARATHALVEALPFDDPRTRCGHQQPPAECPDPWECGPAGLLDPAPQARAAVCCQHLRVLTGSASACPPMTPTLVAVAC